MLSCLDLGSRHLVLEQLPAADAQARQDREREDDDPDPAEPLRELAPDREAAREVLDVPTTLPPVVLKPDIPSKKASIGPVELEVSREDVGERPERRRREPCQGDDEEPLADAEAMVATRGASDGRGDAGRDRRRRGTARPARRSRSRTRSGGERRG